MPDLIVKLRTAEGEIQVLSDPEPGMVRVHVVRADGSSNSTRAHHGLVAVALREDFDRALKAVDVGGPYPDDLVKHVQPLAAHVAARAKLFEDLGVLKPERLAH